MQVRILQIDATSGKYLPFIKSKAEQAIRLGMSWGQKTFQFPDATGRYQINGGFVRIWLSGKSDGYIFFQNTFPTKLHHGPANHTITGDGVFSYKGRLGLADLFSVKNVGTFAKPTLPTTVNTFGPVIPHLPISVGNSNWNSFYSATPTVFDIAENWVVTTSAYAVSPIGVSIIKVETTVSGTTTRQIDLDLPPTLATFIGSQYQRVTGYVSGSPSTFSFLTVSPHSTPPIWTGFTGVVPTALPVDFLITFDQARGKKVALAVCMVKFDGAWAEIASGSIAGSFFKTYAQPITRRYALYEYDIQSEAWTAVYEDDTAGRLTWFNAAAGDPSVSFPTTTSTYGTSSLASTVSVGTNLMLPGYAGNPRPSRGVKKIPLYDNTGTLREVERVRTTSVSTDPTASLDTLTVPAVSSMDLAPFSIPGEYNPNQLAIASSTAPVRMIAGTKLYHLSPTQAEVDFTSAVGIGYRLGYARDLSFVVITSLIDLLSVVTTAGVYTNTNAQTDPASMKGVISVSADDRTKLTMSDVTSPYMLDGALVTAPISGTTTITPGAAVALPSGLSPASAVTAYRVDSHSWQKTA